MASEASRDIERFPWLLICIGGTGVSASRKFVRFVVKEVSDKNERYWFRCVAMKQGH